MNNLSFNLIGTLAGSITAGILFTMYLRLFRRIPILESFTGLEKHILNFQLFALSLWTIGALSFYFYLLWSGFNFEAFIKEWGNGNLIIAFMNWILFGFIAVASIFPGVSILSSLRSWSWREPVKGRESLIIGILIIALLSYWTWRVFLPSL
jgi:hypothetical protein